MEGDLVEDSGGGLVISIPIAGGSHGFRDGGGPTQAIDLYHTALLCIHLTVHILYLMDTPHTCHTRGIAIDSRRIHISST